MKNRHNSQKVGQHIADVMQKRTPQHKEEFDKWIENNEYALDCITDLSDKKTLSEMLDNFKNDNKEEDAKELVKKISRLQSRRRIITTALSMSAAVAAVAIMLWFNHSPEQFPIKAERKTKNSSIINAPKLITSKGETINLNNSINMVIGENIAINESGALELKSNNSADSLQNKMNKLIVPCRNSYTIKLADGTTAVLNANSTLEFPEAFSGNSRNVSLTGEGYFEVARDNTKPFTVTANGMKISVHGTKFNINTFQNEKVVTFLLEGSVSVGSDRMREVMLHPMQVMNATTHNGAYVINDMKDEGKYLSWLKNDFVFNATPLSEVVEQLENWYGIRFDEKSFSDTTELLTGAFSRNTDLPELIKAIQTSINADIIEKNNIYYIHLKK